MGLLLFGNTSKEFIHLFAAHEDTVHHTNEDNGALSFDKQHHHCQFLGDALPPFIATAPIVPVLAAVLVYEQLRIAPVNLWVDSRIYTPGQRGPPHSMI